MPLEIWTEQSNYSFGTIAERTPLDIPLPVTYEDNFEDSTGLTFSVISGHLPPGLRIDADHIKGTPFEVPRETEFKFCIRAKIGTAFADRTYKMTITGEDAPTWQTNEGLLPIGPNDAYYILDSSFVDFQMAAIDFDTTAGQSLKYFISSGDGELPPGLILTKTGRVTGFIQPLLIVTSNDGSGSYDTGLYDGVAFDFGQRSTNGYDSYVYDSIFFDYSSPTTLPRKLNRNYEFIVSVTDGDSVAKRKFRIYVVGDDFFRSDNTVLQSGSGVFTADITFARIPIWITPNYLGLRRANNYQTYILDTYDAIPGLPQAYYSLEVVNPEIESLAVRVSTDENREGDQYLRIKNSTAIPTNGLRFRLRDTLAVGTSQVYTITSVTTISTGTYKLGVSPNLAVTVPNDTQILIGTDSVLPPGMTFDATTGEVFGNVPYQPAVTISYNFTIKATRFFTNNESASARRIFTVDILGEVDSTIKFLTNSNLGTINANIVSTLAIKATTTVPNAIIIYQLLDGAVPPGLTLSLDGQLIGKVNQFGTVGHPGIITFDNNAFTLDANDTTFDRVYEFTVRARDQFLFSQLDQTFTLTIDTPNNKLYSNISVKPFLKQTERAIFADFINDTNIFDPNLIYRLGDSNFGIQKSLKMIIYGGIETLDAAKYIEAMGRNHKKKRFRFGSVKTAEAKLTGTNTVVYEVVYVEMIDPLENSKGSAALTVNMPDDPLPIYIDERPVTWSRDIDVLNEDAPWGFRPNHIVSTDSQNYFAGGESTRFPGSVTNWQYRLKQLGETEREYLPLYMRSIQTSAKRELGFVKAVPLCFTLPGQSNAILLNIKNNGFDFNQINYEIDRYIIDSVTGYGNDKYLAFNNDRTTII
jgi:hypothetical protein